MEAQQDYQTHSLTLLSVLRSRHSTHQETRRRRGSGLQNRRKRHQSRLHDLSVSQPVCHLLIHILTPLLLPHRQGGSSGLGASFQEVVPVHMNQPHGTHERCVIPYLTRTTIQPEVTFPKTSLPNGEVWQSISSTTRWSYFKGLNTTSASTEAQDQDGAREDSLFFSNASGKPQVSLKLSNVLISSAFQCRSSKRWFLHNPAKYLSPLCAAIKLANPDNAGSLSSR